MASGRHSRARAVVFLIGGIAAGMVCLFFAIANAAWIPVRIPAWPWSTEPFWFVFEARLWAVMLLSFVLGAAVVLLGCLRVRRSTRRGDPAADERIHRLEQELQRVTRLLTLTQNKR